MRSVQFRHRKEFRNNCTTAYDTTTLYFYYTYLDTISNYCTYAYNSNNYYTYAYNNRNCNYYPYKTSDDSSINYSLTIYDTKDNKVVMTTKILVDKDGHLFSFLLR